MSMGTFRYPIVLYSSDGARSRRVEALVDTGATYTRVPRPTLEGLGPEPLDQFVVLEDAARLAGQDLLLGECAIGVGY